MMILHYQDGNYEAIRRVEVLKNILCQLGTDEEQSSYAGLTTANVDCSARQLTNGKRAPHQGSKLYENPGSFSRRQWAAVG